MANDTDITPADLLAHMRAMENRLKKHFTTEISANEKRTAKRIDTLENSLNGRIDRVRSNLTQQIDALDKRLDYLEIRKIPKKIAVHARRLTRIEKHVFLTAA